MEQLGPEPVVIAREQEFLVHPLPQRQRTAQDALAGEHTYGGGRYLLDTVKGADLGGADGELVVDFNFAYQPSCAYDPAWACPLAPPGNVVDVELPVGELLPDA